MKKKKTNKKIKFKYLAQKYLNLFGYNIDAEQKTQNKFVNILDFLLLMVYFAFVTTNLIINGTNSLAYILIIITSARSIFKLWREYKTNCDIKQGRVSLKHIICICVYCIITVVYLLLFFAIKGAQNTSITPDVNKVINTILCYLTGFYNLIYVVFEATSILVNFYNATLKQYSQTN